MSTNRFQSNFRARTDVLGNLTPHNKVQPEIRSPSGHWKPASWLPVVFKQSDAAQGEDAYVISSGKVVAFDAQGRIVPAGLRDTLGTSGLAYTADDVTWGVYNLVTGARVSAAVTYTAQQVAQAIVNRGLVTEEELVAYGVTMPVNSADDYQDVIDLFISNPIGVIAYDVHVWAGLAEDGDQWFTNYTKQHAIQFLTEQQMKVPQHVVTNTQETFDAATLDGAGSTAYATTELPASGEYFDITNIRQYTRWGALSASAPVVALGLGWRLAKNTSRTPVTCDTSGILVTEKTSAGKVLSEGDWFLDAEVGVLFIHSDAWDTAVAGAVTFEIDYYEYTTAASDGAQQIHFDGPCRPGDFVTFDAQSNFRVATAAEIAAGQRIVGRVLAIESEPKGLLGSVKTGFNFSGAPTSAQTPGTATGGYSDLITLSPETVADQIVIVNVRV